MLKNKHVGLVAGLLDRPLKGAERRNRDQIIESLRARMEEMEEKRISIIKKHAEKDEKGEAKIDEKENRYIIKDQKKFDKEYSEYLEEDIAELKQRPYKWLKTFLERVGETEEMGAQDSKNFEDMMKCFKPKKMAEKK